MKEPMESAAKIVADADGDWWASAEGVATRRRIEEEVRARYRKELERASWPKRAALSLRIRYDIARECDRAELEILWAKRADSRRR